MTLPSGCCSKCLIKDPMKSEIHHHQPALTIDEGGLMNLLANAHLFHLRCAQFL